MTDARRSPTELRSMFGENLRRLSRGHSSVSDLSRKLGINRTQFNRYLSGESFPRPDVLERICTYFEVDARILLEPVADIPRGGQILTGPELGAFFGAGLDAVTEQAFPGGFYRFSRRSFVSDSQYVLGVVLVYRSRGRTFLRGYEAREAMQQQGLSGSPANREFRGFVTRQDDGVAMLIARRNSLTCSFNFLSRVPSIENNFWVGYITRTVPESPHSNRVTRMVYEHIGSYAQALPAARSAGLVDADRLMPFHRRLLNIGTPFA